MPGQPRQSAMTVEEIGEALGVSSQRVCQIYANAMRKLRANEAARKLLDLAEALDKERG